MTLSKRMAAARKAAAAVKQNPAPQPAPGITIPPGPGASPAPQLDQSAIIASNGDAKVVPNDRSAHMRAKRAGEGNVQDYDPNRARARAEQVQEAAVYSAPGAGNARPHMPEGNPNVRTQGVNRVGGSTRHQPHVRDATRRTPAPAGEGNVKTSHQKIRDARLRPGARPPQPTQFQQPQGVVHPQAQAPAQPHPQAQAPQAPVPQGAPTQAQPNPGAPPSPQGIPHAVGPGPQGQQVADLTVIMATYRRPQYLRPQLQAIAEQTHRPADIWIWVNDWGQGSGLHDHEAEAHYTFFRSKVNLGPWVRFSLANECQTKYVLILDDDCFPGPQWIGRAIAQLEQMESQGETAVICAQGRIFDPEDPEKYVELGPDSLPEEDALIDEGTKAWLFPRALLDVFNAFPRAPSPVGWGLHFAAALQAAGLFQLVLGCDAEDQSGWGSLPVNAEEQQGVALSSAMAQYPQARAVAWNFYRDPEIGGWLPLALTPDPEAESEAQAQAEPDAPLTEDEVALGNADEAAADAAAETGDSE